MENSTATILTPDQRLRVFVSSTLQELSEERIAVKKAIQNIQLTPVMFEMGARPHAPRNLYREYLAQSQIFVGIYWDSYGWVSPEETISGLEDEYNRSANMPRLIYIKKSNGHREDRLTQLINRIQTDDKVSYKTFTNADELGLLIINDLALLLTERFNLTIQNKMSESIFKAFHSIPAVPNALIGREKNVIEIIALLEDPTIRLVTLTGPGGIGKTRLSIETARRLQYNFQDGAAFIPLAPVKDHTLVPETICYALGIKISGGNILESLKLFLNEKSFLLVLDNFEQVIQASSIIDDLLLAAPGLKILVTSRERLSLTFEHLYAVPVLPDSFSNYTEMDENKFPPAIELFLNRAKSVQPSFKITDQNKEIIFNICRRLEGLPLAIELAAGQINLFNPALLLQKLDRRLDILKGNFRDIPDRQKTIRKTIEWSFDLLTPAEQTMLLHISLYASGCQLTTIEAIGAENGQDVYAVLESLINKSLLMKQDEEFQVRFQMLETVREFALEKLGVLDLIDKYKQIQADYYFNALKDIKLQKSKIDQVEILKCLEIEHINIRQVLDFLLEKNDLRKIAEIAWNLWLFWWVNAHTKEGYLMLKKVWEMHEAHKDQFDDHSFAILAANVGIMSFLQRDFKTFNESLGTHLSHIQLQDDDELIATSSMIVGVVKTIMQQYAEADQLLQIGLDRFKKIGLTTGISLVLSALGRNSVYKGKTSEAKTFFKESIALAKKDHNEISVIICMSGFALCEVMEKNADAKNYLRECILLSQSLHFYEAIAWSMEIWALVSINENRIMHAVTLMGAVDQLRSTTQLPVWEDLQAIIINAKNQIEQQMDPAMFATAWEQGTAMNLEKMVTFTMAE